MAINYKDPTFLEGCKKLLADLKPMTWKQRIDHIWYYYKPHMLIGFIILVVLVGAISMAFNAGKEELVSGIMVNISISQEGHNYLQKDYLEDLGGKSRQSVGLYYANFSSLENAAYSDENYSSAQMLIGLVSGGRLDYMILDQFGMEFYISQDVYFDLREFYTQQELEELDAAKRVIYAMEKGTTDRIPIAVDISDAAFVKENITAEEKTFFAISGNSPDLEMCRDVLARIYSWQKPAQ